MHGSIAFLNFGEAPFSDDVREELISQSLQPLVKAQMAKARRTSLCQGYTKQSPSSDIKCSVGIVIHGNDFSFALPLGCRRFGIQDSEKIIQVWKAVNATLLVE